MADKLAEQITEALRLAARDPAGLPLMRGKSGDGLFAATSAGKAAAQKALAEGLLRLVPPGSGARAGAEIAAATEKGVAYVAEATNLRPVLEDFVTAIEKREREFGQLRADLNRVGESLAALKTLAESLRPAAPAVAPAAVEAAPDIVAGAVVAALAQWGRTAAQANEDCPLPELFALVRTEAVTLGRFHDALRGLQAAGRVYLHPWTGPLYALPVPEMAMLSGHNVAYYASLGAG